MQNDATLTLLKCFSVLLKSFGFKFTLKFKNFFSFGCDYNLLLTICKEGLKVLSFLNLSVCVSFFICLSYNFKTKWLNFLRLCEIWGADHLLGCDTLLCGRHVLTFQRHLILPSWCWITLPFTLMMEAADLSKTLLHTYQTTLQNSVGINMMTLVSVPSFYISFL